MPLGTLMLFQETWLSLETINAVLAKGSLVLKTLAERLSSLVEISNPGSSRQRHEDIRHVCGEPSTAPSRLGEELVDSSTAKLEVLTASKGENGTEWQEVNLVSGQPYETIKGTLATEGDVVCLMPLLNSGRVGATNANGSEHDGALYRIPTARRPGPFYLPLPSYLSTCLPSHLPIPSHCPAFPPSCTYTGTPYGDLSTVLALPGGTDGTDTSIDAPCRANNASCVRSYLT